MPWVCGDFRAGTALIEVIRRAMDSDDDGISTMLERLLQRAATPDLAGSARP